MDIFHLLLHTRNVNVLRYALKTAVVMDHVIVVFVHAMLGGNFLLIVLVLILALVTVMIMVFVIVMAVVLVILGLMVLIVIKLLIVLIILAVHVLQ